MNIYEVAQRVADGIQNDATFRAYCAATFLKQPYFFVGFDGNNPPNSSVLPFVVVVPSSEQIEDNTYKSYSLNLAGVVIDNTRTDATSKTSYAGYNLISEFSNEIFEAVQRMIQAGEISEDLSMLSWGASQYAAYYPEYHFARELNLTGSY